MFRMLSAEFTLKPPNQNFMKIIFILVTNG